MKSIKILLVAGLLTAGLAACADYYGEGPYGYGYDYGAHHGRYGDSYWQDGRRYCRSAYDPDAYIRCD